jgi:flagellar basal body-associated protein FliL
MRRRTLLALIALAATAPTAAMAEEKKKAGGASYIQINTLTGATARPGGRRGVMTVECGLDVPDDKLRERANLSLPMLRAAYVQVVQTYAAGLSTGAPPSPE